ncbi:hypothetical protein CEXT_457331 [Caerostris extrusa]|uniref:Uncharacterized protein n=1 Tax=Caerostris extrusa TaxID=172846 RepID=A0AAV4PUA6_CAEEX|nr:hypothetical protein CEXT_457331 [Caerostris extrusa]
MSKGDTSRSEMIAACDSILLQVIAACDSTLLQFVFPKKKITDALQNIINNEKSSESAEQRGSLICFIYLSSVDHSDTSSFAASQCEVSIDLGRESTAERENGTEKNERMVLRVCQNKYEVPAMFDESISFNSPLGEGYVSVVEEQFSPTLK